MAEFGATAWGRCWLRTVERTRGTPNPLLPRARSIARNQQAVLTLAPGLVTAAVSEKAGIATVRIELPTWPADVDRTAALHLRQFSARRPDSPAGDLPDSLADDLAEAGVPIAASLDEIVATCTCRARRRPCAHILATIYAVVLRVDEQPRLAVELRTERPRTAGPADPGWIPLTQIDPSTFYDSPGGKHTSVVRGAVDPEPDGSAGQPVAPGAAGRGPIRGE